ncbi:MAG TPA: hypothetical protein VMB80_15995 [Candidatus Acidoferrum sp.]|nr:hypothetical protein [Candidatus Acidoferrum sp.]
MTRIIEPEWLDELPADDPDAVRSRRDLHRVNAWMRHYDLMAGALQNQLDSRPAKHLVELGAGDGDFLLQVARKLAPNCSNLNVTLLDRQDLVQPETLSGFASLGWHAEAVAADVFEWSRTGQPADVVVANLFLHHFYDISLAGLLGAIAGRARLFIALEPRRAFWPLFCSRLLWGIGCGPVTQHDAVLSVRAGFEGDELSRLWPAGAHWQLSERPAGLFSHLFLARRIQ